MNKAQERNLRKLADGLLNLPDGYEHFDMDRYCEYRNGGFETYDPSQAKKKMHTCGTSGCALGHAPLMVSSPRKYESWEDYCERLFFEHFSKQYRWCFDCDWAQADNTPQGAALRILYMLDFGIPNDFEKNGYFWKEYDFSGKQVRRYKSKYEIVGE